MATYILNINCPDQKGIIATVTNFIHQKSGNIVYIDQYVDRENKLFFMRLECEFMNGNFTKEQFSTALDESIAKQYALEYDLYDKD
jgi:formyltetrahydrofolate deformylase